MSSDTPPPQPSPEPSSPSSQEDSFAALFESTKSAAAPKRRSFRVGDVLEAVVIKVGRDSIFLELDGKRPAFIEAEEMRAPDGTMTVAVGDTVRARVVEVDVENGSVRLGKTLGRPGSPAAIEQAREAGMPIDGKVTGVNKGGLEVEIGGARAFCPMSQIDTKFVQDASTLVGKSMTFIVTDIRDKGIVVSRRAVLEIEGREAMERTKREIAVGAQMRGTVTSVRDFGAFVDLGGIEGMIPASEIGHDRSVAIADAVAVGDTVDVQVREVKEVSTTRGPRTGSPSLKITLSLKALARNPWEDVETTLTVGKVCQGTVTRVVEFGAFVRLAAGVEGLLHVSELGGKPGHPAATLTAGQSIAVVVKSIDRAEKRVALVPAPDGVAVGGRVSEVKLSVGATVTGVVDRIETYGVFLQLDGTRGRSGRGLIPSAELGVPRGTDIRKTFPEGTKLTTKVLEIGDGRVRLSVRAVKDDEERSHYDGFRAAAAAPGKMGTLGDLLKKREQKKT